jgi:hypothetical protein
MADWCGGGWRTSGNGDSLVLQFAITQSDTLAICYTPLLHCLYNPAGTTRDFTSTCAFPPVPTNEFKRRLIEVTLTQTAGYFPPW